MTFKPLTRRLEDLKIALPKVSGPFGAYIPANLIGATLAAFAYDWIATPRKVFRPIKEAVTEPDRAPVEEGVLA